jgi:hypothetical protein
MLTESSKADHGEESERRARDHRPEQAAAGGRLELHDARDIAFAVSNGPQADEDDDEKAGQFHAGQHDICLYAFADPAEIDAATSP